MEILNKKIYTNDVLMQGQIVNQLFLIHRFFSSRSNSSTWSPSASSSAYLTREKLSSNRIPTEMLICSTIRTLHFHKMQKTIRNRQYSKVIPWRRNRPSMRTWLARRTLNLRKYRLILIIVLFYVLCKKECRLNIQKLFSFAFLIHNDERHDNTQSGNAEWYPNRAGRQTQSRQQDARREGKLLVHWSWRTKISR